MPKANRHSTTPPHVENQPTSIEQCLAVVVAQGRPAVETAIAALIECLDAADGDPDREPSLGASEVSISQVYQHIGSCDQRYWSEGCDRGDIEDDRDNDLEAGIDDEFSAQPPADGTASHGGSSAEEAEIVAEGRCKLRRHTKGGQGAPSCDPAQPAGAVRAKASCRRAPRTIAVTGLDGLHYTLAPVH